MAIKIVNDTGAVIGTQILNLDEDGAEIGAVMGVEGLSLEFSDGDGVVRAQLRLGLVKAEVTATTAEWLAKDPVSGKYESVDFIRFKSGACLQFGENGDVAHYAHGTTVSVVQMSSGRTMKFNAVRDPDGS
jgi:hypothetical protein